MNHALLRADKLALALKQIDQAGRNLRQVQIWADRHQHPHLALGTQDLIRGLTTLGADLQTLVRVVRAQASNDQSQPSINPAKETRP